jgi:dCMP deaminase
MRITREEALSEIVKVVARRTTCPRKAVGAIIVREGRILSSGYNGSPSGLPHCGEVGCITGPDGGCLRAVHAEVNAIAFAARQGVRINRATMWTTVAPCLNCAKLIINSGIIEVQSLEEYRDPAGVELLLDARVKFYAQKP